MSERYEKILERSKEMIGDRNTAEFIVIAEEFLPQIEKGINKSDNGTYVISMKDMMKQIPQSAREGFFSLESFFSILCSVNWDNWISTDINCNTEDFCLYLAFNKPYSREEEPSIENCYEKWMNVFTGHRILPH